MGGEVALAERWCGPRESESETQVCLHLAVGMRTSHLTLPGSNIELDIWHFGFLLGEVKNSLVKWAFKDKYLKSIFFSIII